jgi:very-short-patch-repair endonuclease
MSKLSDQVLGVIKEVYPQLKVKTETYVVHKNQKLYLDFFIPQIDLVVEVHGRQHDQFVKHFHGDQSGYKASKKRDKLKEEWAEANGMLLMALREKDLPLTKEKFLTILKGLQK